MFSSSESISPSQYPLVPQHAARMLHKVSLLPPVGRIVEDRHSVLTCFLLSTLYDQHMILKRRVCFSVC